MTLKMTSSLRNWLFLSVFLLSLFCEKPTYGKTFYCPNTYYYRRYNLYNEGVRVDTKSSIKFQTKGNHDAHILLQRYRYLFLYKVVEIVLGRKGNSQSVIRKGRLRRAVATYYGPVLDPESYRWFWIFWSDGCIMVGKGNVVGYQTIMDACGLIKSVTRISISYGFGGSGYFTFDIDGCVSNPCSNGATCISMENNYTCTCASGWEGYNCDIEINACVSNPCLNEATCNSLGSNYTCTCADGWREYNCDIPDVLFYCYPNNTIYVQYLPPGANYYAMQNVSDGADVQCTITTVDPTTVKMTGCSKDFPILFTFGSYTSMETNQMHGGKSLTAITIKCNEIPYAGKVHTVNNILAASLELEEKTKIDPIYYVTSSLNTTSTIVGNPVAWSISFPEEYILEVSNCTAYAGHNDASSQYVTLISSGGCNTDHELISDFVDNMDGSATAVINAFKFYQVENVFLLCFVTVCADVAGQSCDVSCSRTKRAITRETEASLRHNQRQRSIQNILHVVEPGSSGTVLKVPAFTVGLLLTVLCAITWL